MTYSFTITTVGATTADSTKLQTVEKAALRYIKEYYNNGFASSGGVS